MTPRKFSVAMIAIVMSAVIVGCQAKKTGKKVSLGRNARGAFNEQYKNDPTDAYNNMCGSYTVAGKNWGGVILANGQLDQTFQEALSLLTSPSLAGVEAGDELGEVSSQADDATGVRFWGNVELPQGNGQIDMTSAEIRVEIFDSNACQVKDDGVVRPMIPIHIGQGQPDFVMAEGYRNGSHIVLTFQDDFGVIQLDGNVNGQDYVGTMRFTSSAAGEDTVDLGEFTVPASGFFTN